MDPQWGATPTTTDLGAFGIAQISTTGVPGPPLAIVTASLPSFAIGSPYSQMLVASGGVQPYKGWAVTAGSLPPGITLSAIGLLSGTPVTAGSVSFTIQVTDGAGKIAAQAFTATVLAAVPTILSNGVVNGASYTAGAVAPGEIVAIFGYSLGPGTLQGLQLDRTGYVTNLLGGTQVTFDGVPAPLIYVEAGQVGAIVPYVTGGKTSTTLQVSYQGKTTNTLTIPVASTAPGIFTKDATGKNQAAIVNQDGSQNGPDNPAPAGSVVSLYATGEGQTNPPGVDGKPGDLNPTQPVQDVTVSIGGVDAPVKYKGGAYGLTAGVLQVNVEVPQGVTPGNAVPIVLHIGGKDSAAGVTMAVE